MNNRYGLAVTFYLAHKPFWALFFKQKGCLWGSWGHLPIGAASAGRDSCSAASDKDKSKVVNPTQVRKVFIRSARISLLRLGGFQKSPLHFLEARSAWFCLGLPGRARRSPFLSPDCFSGLGTVHSFGTSLLKCAGELWPQVLDSRHLSWPFLPSVPSHQLAAPTLVT